MGGKTLRIAFQYVHLLQHMLQNKLHLFVARFTAVFSLLKKEKEKKISSFSSIATFVVCRVLGKGSPNIWVSSMLESVG